MLLHYKLLRDKSGLTQKDGKETPEHHAWRDIRRRCYDDSFKSYKYYGGRGITMYEPWINDYKAFFEYVGEKPSKSYSIDRINNDGNYEPGNVRWINWNVQAANRRHMNNTRIGVTELKNGSWHACLNFQGNRIFCKTFRSRGLAIYYRRRAEIEYNVYDE